MVGVDLEGDEFSVWRKRAGEPDGAVSTECADFKDSSGALDAGEKMKQLALVGGYVD